MKKTALVITAIFAALALSGCNQGSESSASEARTTADPFSYTRPVEIVTQTQQTTAATTTTTAEEFDILDPALEFDYSVVKGEVTINEHLLDNAASVIVPDEIEGCPVTVIGKYAFQDSDVNSVRLPDSIKEIREGAFMDCYDLRMINLPDGITFIGASAFENCSDLKMLTMPASLERIEKRTFCYCYDLRDVEIGENVKKISDEAFMDCTSLHSIVIPQRVSDIGEKAFNGCDELAGSYRGRNKDTRGGFL